MVVVGAVLILLGRQAYKKGNWLGVVAAVAVLVWLGRGIGQGAP